MTNPVDVVGYVMLGGMMIIMLIATVQSQAALQDPNNTNVVFVDQLTRLSELTGRGQWNVTIYRQSGNVHSAQIVTGSAAAALATALATFRRAKIDAIVIKANGPDRLAFQRLYHNHRGSNEGKKVGAAEIWRA